MRTRGNILVDWKGENPWISIKDIRAVGYRDTDHIPLGPELPSDDDVGLHMAMGTTC
jgi:hypothetical protein